MENVLGKLTSRAWPWAIGATVLVAGFMYWLYAESSAIQVAVITTDTTETLPHVADSAFVAGPDQFSGQRILLEPVRVSEQLGRAALTLDLPGLADYPAILEGSVLETEIRIVGGDNLAIAGWVYALNDSILDVWAQRGLFDPEHREKLTGKTTFFLVDSLDFVFPGEEGSGAGSGQ
jgi:hypothetical protein